MAEVILPMTDAELETAAIMIGEMFGEHVRSIESFRDRVRHLIGPERAAEVDRVIAQGHQVSFKAPKYPATLPL